MCLCLLFKPLGSFGYIHLKDIERVNVFKSYFLLFCISLLMMLAEKYAEFITTAFGQADPVIPPTSPPWLQVRFAAAVSVW